MFKAVHKVSSPSTARGVKPGQLKATSPSQNATIEPTSSANGNHFGTNLSLYGLDNEDDQHEKQKSHQSPIHQLPADEELDSSNSYDENPVNNMSVNSPAPAGVRNVDEGQLISMPDDDDDDNNSNKSNNNNTDSVFSEETWYKNAKHEQARTAHRFKNCLPLPLDQSESAPLSSSLPPPPSPFASNPSSRLKSFVKSVSNTNTSVDTAGQYLQPIMRIIDSKVSLSWLFKKILFKGN